MRDDAGSIKTLTAQPKRNRAPSAFRYAVVDLAAAPSLKAYFIGRMRVEVETLFDRDFPADLLFAGPWLADLARTQPLKDALEDLGAAVPWGYYIDASIDIVSLRHTLRRFNLVEIPNPRRAVLFRYWDPRIMQVFLEIADHAQRARLFEFVDTISSPGFAFTAAYNE